MGYSVLFLLEFLFTLYQSFFLNLLPYQFWLFGEDKAESKEQGRNSSAETGNQQPRREVRGDNGSWGRYPSF